jgi:hypothetical protein
MRTLLSVLLLGIVFNQGASAALHNHWEFQEVGVSGQEATVLFQGLNLATRTHNGGFRTLSKIKAGDFGSMRVVCDTYPVTTCKITWMDSSGQKDFIQVSSAEAQTSPCFGNIVMSNEDVEFTCSLDSISVRRK